MDPLTFILIELLGLLNLIFFLKVTYLYHQE